MLIIFFVSHFLKCKMKKNAKLKEGIHFFSQKPQAHLNGYRSKLLHSASAFHSDVMQEHSRILKVTSVLACC